MDLEHKKLKLLLKVTEITTEHQKWPKISKNSKKTVRQNPPQELEVSPRSGLYFLVFIIIQEGIKTPPPIPPIQASVPTQGLKFALFPSPVPLHARAVQQNLRLQKTCIIKNFTN